MKVAPEILVHGKATALERQMAEVRSTIEPHPLVRETGTWGNASRYTFRLADVKLCAILEVELHDDGHYWAHLSASAQSPRRLPSWKELRWAKEHFLGDRRAIMVLPPRAEYINITFNVFNLYACLSGNPLPDFRYRDPFTDAIGI